MRTLRERPRVVIASAIVGLTLLAAIAAAAAILTSARQEPAADARLERAQRVAERRGERIGDLERRVALLRQLARERSRRLRVGELAPTLTRQRERQQRRPPRAPKRPERDRR